MTIKLGVYPATNRVLARLRLYGPLGEVGNCLPELKDELQFQQWVALEPFTRMRLRLTLQGSGRVESSRGDRHSVHFRMVLNLVRIRSLLPNR